MDGLVFAFLAGPMVRAGPFDSAGPTRARVEAASTVVTWSGELGRGEPSGGVD
ncbi:MAG TPA: hypothetical protein VIL00_11385 [Pseudonocardiaceae bacterium]